MFLQLLCALGFIYDLWCFWSYFHDLKIYFDRNYVLITLTKFCSSLCTIFSNVLHSFHSIRGSFEGMWMPHSVCVSFSFYFCHWSAYLSIVMKSRLWTFCSSVYNFFRYYTVHLALKNLDKVVITTTKGKAICFAVK